MSVRVIEGDCRLVLPTLPDNSVQCCVTSPPYFGLRDYGVVGQIGLEPSVDAFVGELVAVFREVRRVLRDDGVLFLNLGDSYASGGSGGYSEKSTLAGFTNPETKGRVMNAKPITRKPSNGLKPKDLIGVPWRVAFALQADGWWLRSEITWCKKAPMPESVTDRPTTATEKIFLLTKSARYFYDGDAVREPYNEASLGRYASPMQSTAPTGRQPGRDIARKVREEGIRDPNPAGRNQRNFWLLGPEPFPDAHFATFVTEIPRRAILAGTSEKGACPACGSPWARVVEREQFDRTGDRLYGGTLGHNPSGKVPGSNTRGMPNGGANTTGWQPACACPPHDPVPCCVLDPFAGAGTTALVADRLGRDSIAVELNPEYAAMIRRRITHDAPLFADLR